MLNLLKVVSADEEGATAIEYGMLIALVAIAAFTGYEAFGNSLTNMFEEVGTEMQNATK